MKSSIILLAAMSLLVACHNTPNPPSPASRNTPSLSAAPDSTAATAQSPATASQAPASPKTPSPKTILFFGNSLTAGYGVGADHAFPAIIGRRIDSLHWPYKVINAGLSGETSAGGKNRIGWILRQPVDVFVLELGANDGLRGTPVAATIANLQAIIDSVKRKYPAAKIVLAGMQALPTMGSTYTTSFRSIFPQLAARNKAALIPFLLQGVGGIPQLNQSDGIHPTEQGHRIVADNVWRILRPLLHQ